MNIAITSRYRKKWGNHFQEWECVPRTFCIVASMLGIDLVSIPTSRLSKDVLGLCDGLIVTGSSININPAIYGGRETNLPNAINEYSMDKALIDFFMERNLPIMGVCGGLQAINVALGGTLKLVKNHRDVYHGLDVSGTGFLSPIKDICYTVNSFHGFAVDNVGAGLQVRACCDGVVEALESMDGKIFGVQWHPEEDMNFDSKHSVFYYLLEHLVSV